MTPLGGMLMGLATALLLLGSGLQAQAVEVYTKPRLDTVATDTVKDGLLLTGETLRRWRFLYKNITQEEWSECLYGDRTEDGVVIVHGHLADIVLASGNRVVSSCPALDRSIGQAHSHRGTGPNVCSPSPDDTAMLSSAERWRSIIVIVCGLEGDELLVAWQIAGYGHYKTTRIKVPPL